MPTASRNDRRKRRLRRNVSLLNRELRSLNARHVNAHFTLLAVLVNAGGSITISADKVGEAMADMRFLNWKTARQEDGSMIVTAEDPRVETPAENPDAVVAPRSVASQLMGSPADAIEGEHAEVLAAIEEHITGDTDAISAT